MFVTIDSARTFVSYLLRVEKIVKKYGNLMNFVIFAIFNRGVLCHEIDKISWNFGSIVFLSRIEET